MRVAELKEILEHFADDDDTLVMVAVQPNYPLESGLGDEFAIVEVEGEQRLYLAAHESSNYLAGVASEELGWS